jgi:hypothetical protein
MHDMEVLSRTGRSKYKEPARVALSPNIMMEAGIRRTAAPA